MSKADDVTRTFSHGVPKSPLEMEIIAASWHPDAKGIAIVFFMLR
jgi:hypothetical protein